MKLVSYLNEGKGLVGLYVNEKIYNLHQCGKLLNINVPDNMKALLEGEHRA